MFIGLIRCGVVSSFNYFIIVMYIMITIVIKIIYVIISSAQVTFISYVIVRQ